MNQSIFKNRNRITIQSWKLIYNIQERKKTFNENEEYSKYIINLNFLQSQCPEFEIQHKKNYKTIFGFKLKRILDKLHIWDKSNQNRQYFCCPL